MVITVRGARACELPAVRDIISSAWENPEDEPALWDYVFSSHPGFSPQGVRVAFAGERPVACAVVLPCRLRTPRGLAPGAELTLVGCRPEYQRQGYGGAVVRDALAYMAGRGLALAVFWGDPLFYGRFGAVPVLPVYRTTLDVGATRPPSLLTDPAPDLRPAEEEDLKAVAALYRWGLSSYLLAPSRLAQPWLWRVRNPDLHALLVLGDRSGYAFVSADRAEDVLVVREASVQAGTSQAGATPTPGQAGAARRLLRGLLAEAGRRRLARLRLSLPPDNLLARIAVDWGAQQIRLPVSEGLAVVTVWEALLPPGWQVVRAGEGEDVAGLALDGQTVLAADRAAVTRLVTGYRTPDDLLLAGQAKLLDAGALASDAALSRLRADFRSGPLRYFEAPYFFWL